MGVRLEFSQFVAVFSEWFESHARSSSIHGFRKVKHVKGSSYTVTESPFEGKDISSFFEGDKRGKEALEKAYWQFSLGSTSDELVISLARAVKLLCDDGVIFTHKGGELQDLTVVYAPAVSVHRGGKGKGGDEEELSVLHPAGKTSISLVQSYKAIEKFATCKKKMPFLIEQMGLDRWAANVERRQQMCEQERPSLQKSVLSPSVQDGGDIGPHWWVAGFVLSENKMVHFDPSAIQYQQEGVSFVEVPASLRGDLPDPEGTFKRVPLEVFETPPLNWTTSSSKGSTGDRGFALCRDPKFSPPPESVSARYFCFFEAAPPRLLSVEDAAALGGQWGGGLCPGEKAVSEWAEGLRDRALAVAAGNFKGGEGICVTARGLKSRDVNGQVGVTTGVTKGSGESLRVAVRLEGRGDPILLKPRNLGVGGGASSSAGGSGSPYATRESLRLRVGKGVGVGGTMMNGNSSHDRNGHGGSAGEGGGKEEEKGRVNGSNSESSQKKADSEPEFDFGDVVEIFGLQSEKGKAMNGCDGTLEEWDASARRWTVRLFSGDLARLQEKNLELVEVPEEMDQSVRVIVRVLERGERSFVALGTVRNKETMRRLTRLWFRQVAVEGGEGADMPLGLSEAMVRAYWKAADDPCCEALRVLCGRFREQKIVDLSEFAEERDVPAEKLKQLLEGLSFSGWQ
uniref:Uncharacterized protein n=1 Tax=Chromera velia CCMP2878 TaxID=1169474 RepID=A0A0G4HNT5_9ALVE|eukprot:Cvel_1220.t1-p1 / transcript=Cvel_1220.t1 / gene=Cvel_1220 / organism=Chromera_velia_CCMP2878 / gene_product=hypothetical protein / transcript_product=hypothetical protein / location=Cvel_scaffold40:146363-148408(-) / protein_length=682 / sequence_SO=supercontig / SO=protein_coding / is_pseudo=false